MVEHEPITSEHVVIKAALTVVIARVELSERSIAGVNDGIRRLNLLLGLWTLTGWGNCSVNWWSHVTHEGGASTSLELDDQVVPLALTAILKLPRRVQTKLYAALFWIRTPNRSILENHRDNTLAKFAAYWNAFECLVDAVCVYRPQPKLNKSQKQQSIERYLGDLAHAPSARDIDHLYNTVVNTSSFRPKAEHALVVCFGDEAQAHSLECFEGSDSLYQIRNSINHGVVDAENLSELMRIDRRMSRLWLLVLGMLGRMIPIAVPVDPQTKPGNDGESGRRDEAPN